MVCTLFLLATIVALGYPTQAKGPKFGRVVRFEWARPCEMEYNALSCSKVSLDRDERSGNYFVSANCTVSRSVSSWKMGSMTVGSCMEVVSNTTCQHLMTFRNKNKVCATALDPSALWAGFVSKIQPPVRCPFNAGDYSCQGVMVESRKLAAFVPSFSEKVIHPIMVFLFDTGMALHTCIDVGVRVIKDQ